MPYVKFRNRRPFRLSSSLSAALVSAAVAGLAVATGTWSEGEWQSRQDPGQAATTYVGSKACGSCHAREFAAWQASAHAWAMRRSRRDESVADFDGARVSFGQGGSAVLGRDGEQLTARILEPEAKPRKLVLQYFFGHEQIEQHLVSNERGRLQALPFGFDTKRRDWFDIFARSPPSGRLGPLERPRDDGELRVHVLPQHGL